MSAFVADLARTLNFEYKDSDKNTYNGLEMMNFYWPEWDMQSYKENPANEKYFTKHDGTINMTSVCGAYAIATKGHFYQVSEDLKNDLSIIKGHDGKIIESNPDEDDTKLGIEKNSGVTVQARQRIQINFLMNKNQSLFSHLKENYVMPFVFVKRDSIMSQDQV